MSTKGNLSARARTDLGADNIHGVWAAALAELVSYRYVGCQSKLLDRDHAEGWTTMRSHLRSPGSLLGAPLAISMLDTAGINIDRFYHLGLTQIDVQLFDPSLDVARVHTIGTVLREARTQLFTECRFEDAGQPGRVIGVGAANWAVINVTPSGFEYTDPGSGYDEGPDTPSITRAFELEPITGGGLVLPALSSRVGTETLHHGPMLVGLEQTSLRAAASAALSDALALVSWNVRIVRAGRRAPFTMTAEVLSVAGVAVGCRAQMVDNNGDVIAVSHIVYQRPD